MSILFGLFVLFAQTVNGFDNDLPLSCLVSDWITSPEGCVEGFMHQTRNVVQFAEYGGNFCPPLSRYVTCKDNISFRRLKALETIPEIVPTNPYNMNDNEHGNYGGYGGGYGGYGGYGGGYGA